LSWWDEQQAEGTQAEEDDPIYGRALAREIGLPDESETESQCSRDWTFDIHLNQ
jgi:hypothetical protein